MGHTISTEAIGPVDVAVIAFDGNRFDGDIAPALQELEDSGTVKIIDLTFVRKDADGSVSAIEVADSDVADAFARLTPAQVDLLSDEDLRRVAAGLEPDTSAMVIVWDNAWAARFAAALRDSHGRLVAEERIPREAVLDAVAALSAA